MTSADFGQVITGARDALDQIAKGNAGGYKALFSRGEDITLGNPFGGFARGWEQVVEQLERAASHHRDGQTTGFGGGSELSELALRVT